MLNDFETQINIDIRPVHMPGGHFHQIENRGDRLIPEPGKTLKGEKILSFIKEYP